MRALLLLGLFGCDAVYGLTGRQETDAAPGDGAEENDGIVLDGRVTCPASGAPMFDPVSHFVIAGCKDYTTSAMTGQAMMMCGGTIQEGPIGSQNTLPSQITVEGNQTLDDPRLSPAGDEMFVTSYGSGVHTIRTYEHFSGEWRVNTSQNTLPSDSLGNPLFASPPTMASNFRHIIIRRLVAGEAGFSEYFEDKGTWTLLHDYSAASLDASTVSDPSLSPDGLHLVFASNAGGPGEIRYARRSMITESFDTSVKIEVGFENAQYPHMTPDCSRLYFFASNTTFYVQP